MTKHNHLKAVPPPPPPAEPRADLYDYEWKERQRSAAKDWSGIHVRSFRSAPVDIPDRPSWKGWFR